MDAFIDTQLHPVDTCVVCTEPFSAKHQPVTLPCKHIFGHECIKKWLRSGRGNTSSCPNCRFVFFEKKNPKAAFDAPSIWKALCDQPPERLHAFMGKVWDGLRVLWQRKPDGKFSVTEILDQAIIPALVQTASGSGAQIQEQDALADCYNLVAASWDSLGRPNSAHGLAIPLVRLARLMSAASSMLPKWLTTVPRTNRLFWKANACLGLTEEKINWDCLMEAAKLENERYFPLLHLYTMLASQSIAHNAQPTQWPVRRHEVMNLVLERCCVKVGGDHWKGKPSNQFKDVLVVVYEELRRYHLEKNRMSLRGHDGEEGVVKGVWALSSWIVRKDGAAR
ncbi:hypothetical protein P153DRAFT_303863 [Dothidotthia symphoricarpi CBS 119687]|uniref:RING-type domain-containing protein n=1 Tax=Dothidotthia symphoricarpi CBS 119687 TaxID=1392245 RepID=A0A6A5ZYV5_9PLEO|nr:uncharacterized protein P153DRAFT_303863 [Dothidotthia symphoricarpi CBS 119687]KAF2123501.1 hypothetical protein P153DRAFT_303863 [Dothidotthia symphoricarpi CBS 119687]